jgi:hypothetical protein
MEPLSIITITAAATGVAGKVAERAWDRGEKWLASYFKDHREIVQETAQQNALEFLSGLAERIKALEERASASTELNSRVEQTLDDPDFSALLQSAILASARTSSGTKHSILSRAVAERLACEAESLLALASSLAIEKLPLLTPNQINYLALLTFLQVIRPASSAFAVPVAEAEAKYEAWIERSLSCLLPGIQLTPHDRSHLISLSCIQQGSFGPSTTVAAVMRPNFLKDGWDFPKPAFFKENPLANAFEQIYQRNMTLTHLTTAGELIGIYSHDLKVGTETVVNWNFSFQQSHVIHINPLSNQKP